MTDLYPSAVRPSAEPSPGPCSPGTEVLGGNKCTTQLPLAWPSPSSSPALAVFEIVFWGDSMYLQIPQMMLPFPLQAVGSGCSLQLQLQLLSRWTVRVSVKPSGRMVKDWLLMHSLAVTFTLKMT